MSKIILTDVVVKNDPFLPLAKVLITQSSCLRALPRIAAAWLLCTAIVAAPYAVAQGPGGGQGYVPGLQQQQATDQQQPDYQQQGYVQQGQFLPNQAASGAFQGVPAGTELEAKLAISLDSGKAQVGQPVSAKLKAPLFAHGSALIPAGSLLTGSVTEVTSARGSNYQTPGSLVIQFASVQTPDGQTYPISASVKDTAQAASASNGSGRRMMMPMGFGYPMMGMGMGMGMYGMAGMSRMGNYSGSSMMAPMMGMMGMMTVMRVMGSGLGMGNRGGNRASEAKLSKGTQLQLRLNQPIMPTMSAAIQPRTSSQQAPQSGTAPTAYMQAGYAPMQQLPGYAQ